MSYISTLAAHDTLPPRPHVLDIYDLALTILERCTIHVVVALNVAELKRRGHNGQKIMGFHVHAQTHA
jgi:hypothetical protein